jgi:hypothetical protein
LWTRQTSCSRSAVANASTHGSPFRVTSDDKSPDEGPIRAQRRVLTRAPRRPSAARQKIGAGCQRPQPTITCSFGAGSLRGSPAVRSALLVHYASESHRRCFGHESRGFSAGDLFRPHVHRVNLTSARSRYPRSHPNQDRPRHRRHCRRRNSTGPALDAVREIANKNGLDVIGWYWLGSARPNPVIHPKKTSEFSAAYSSKVSSREETLPYPELSRVHA